MRNLSHGDRRGGDGGGKKINEDSRGWTVFGEAGIPRFHLFERWMQAAPRRP